MGLMGTMGSATGGAGGSWPPPRTDWGGASNAFGPHPPPNFFGKILLYTQLMYSVFHLKNKQTVECMLSSVHSQSTV